MASLPLLKEGKLVHSAMLSNDKLKFNGKKVAVVGLGVNNKGLADFLRKKNVNFEVIKDWTSLKELEKKLTGFEVLFRTPGVPYFSEPIQRALKRGAEVSSQTKLFFDLCPCPIIGVTGTKGKGTTASIIAEILNRAGKKVWLAGNIGQDPFEFIDRIEDRDYVVLELSSFQLQDLHKSPHIAVVTNISEDHLDHHKSIEEYTDAKLSVLRYQSSEDFAVLNKTLPEKLKQAGSGQRLWFDKDTALGFQTQLLGNHNLENIAAAIRVSEILKINLATVRQAVKNFKPLPHHLNFVGEKAGVEFIDDSASTNPDSTIAALAAVGKPVVLILGGSDKGTDFSQLVGKLKSSSQVKAIIIIGQVKSKLMKLLKGFSGNLIDGEETMDGIVRQAAKEAGPGDVVLLSPAAASFGLFKNAKDRGDQFIKTISGL